MWSGHRCTCGISDHSVCIVNDPSIAANNGPTPVSCNSTTGICVPRSMVPPAGGPAFEPPTQTITVGCPVLAFLARAGRMLFVVWDLRQSQNRRCMRHRAHPSHRTAKSGAPSFPGRVREIKKAGPPVSYLGTPSGTYLVYNPLTGQEAVLQ